MTGRVRRPNGAADLATLARQARAAHLDERYVAGKRVGRAEGRARGWADMVILLVAGALIGVATFAAYRGGW